MRKYVILCLAILIIVNIIPASSLADGKDDDEDYIVITCTGDVTIGYKNDENHSKSLPYYLEENNMDYSLPFSNIYDITSNDDLTIVNLEVTITDSNNRGKGTYAFKAPYEYIEILTKGGVDAVTIANNHANDYGEQGRIDTIRTLKENNIIVSGEEYAGSYEVDGIRIGMLGYVNFHTRYDYRNAMHKDIAYMNKIYDIVIVNFHWGLEKIYNVSSVQTELGRLAIDLGADLVVGHHPHVVNGVEYYNGRYIVYSMGNCTFSGNSRPYDFDIFLFQQRFKINDDGQVIPYGGKIIPASVSSTYKRNDFTPTPVEGEDAARVIGKIQASSNRLEFGLYDITPNVWMIDPETKHSQK